jgi:hypothetical protein
VFLIDVDETKRKYCITLFWYMYVKYTVKLNSFLKNILTRILLYTRRKKVGRFLLDLWDLCESCAEKRLAALDFPVLQKKMRKGEFLLFFLGTNSTFEGRFLHLLILYKKKWRGEVKKEGGGCGCDL